MHRALRPFLATFAFVVASVINPLYVTGCVGANDANDAFEFGEADMVAVLDAVSAQDRWAFVEGDRRYELTLELSQGRSLARITPSRSWQTRALACGNRTFEQSAAACISSTEMPLVAAVTLHEIIADERVLIGSAGGLAGTLRVIGEQLSNGSISVYSPASDAVSLLIDSHDGRTFSLGTLTLRGFGPDAIAIDYRASR